MRLRSAVGRFATRAGQAFGSPMTEAFHRIAQRTSWVVGSPWTFMGCVAFTALWLIGGLIVGFGSVYQLYYNTTVSAITWILVVLLQGSQNADTRALHLKLDELLRAVAEARTGLVDLQSWPEEDLERLQDQFRRLRAGASGERGPPEAPQTGDRGEREDEAGR